MVCTRAILAIRYCLNIIQNIRICLHDRYKWLTYLRIRIKYASLQENAFREIIAEQ